MFCPACGNEIPDDAKNCEHCGANVEPEITLGPDETTGQQHTQPPASEPPPQSSTPPPSSGGFTPGTAEIKPMELIQEAWQIIQGNLGNFLLFSIIFTVVYYVLSATFIGLLAVPGIMAGYNIVIMRYLRGQGTLDIGKMLQDGWPFWVNMLVFSIVGGILSSIGSVCLVIPGIMISLAFWIAAFLIVDRNAAFGDAMSAAFAIISKYIGELLVFSLILLVIGIVLFIIALIPVLGWLVVIFASLVITPIVAISCYKAYEKIF